MSEEQTSAGASDHETITLHGRAPWVVVALYAAAGFVVALFGPLIHFAVLFVLVPADEASTREVLQLVMSMSGEWLTAAGLFPLLFAAIGLVIELFVFFLERPRVVVDREGFTLKSSRVSELFRSFRWQDVEKFAIVNEKRLPWRPSVGVVLTEDAHQKLVEARDRARAEASTSLLLRREQRKHRKWHAKWEPAMHAVLPEYPEHYSGRNAVELAAELEEFRRRFT